MKFKHLPLIFFLISCQPTGYIPLPAPQPQPEPTPTPVPDTLVVGRVSCAGQPLEGVVVSDGINVTRTDSKGWYRFKDKSYLGYVFVSIPSGYEVPVEKTSPKFFKRLSDSQTPDTLDFVLSKMDQSECQILFFGDIHLANRLKGSDIKQFRDFAAEVNQIKRDVPTYAITLGDMAWNTFWGQYTLADYNMEVAKSLVSDLRIFPTIGNHDHEKGVSDDFNSENEYRRLVGPTFYSFNIGGTHFLSLDDIQYQGEAFTNRISNIQLKWLKQDLAQLSPDTPIVITMHAPLYYQSGSLANRNSFADFLGLLSKFPSVYVVTGHTHILYATDRLKSSVPVFESNSGAVCGAWWMTGSNGYDNLGPDGSPSGYRIMQVKGSKATHTYKGTGKPATFQFRSYDRNTMELSAAKYTPHASESGKKKFEEAAKDWVKPSSDNYVYLNIWGYDSGWKIKVTEEGKDLAVSQLTTKDPLYLVDYLAYEYEHGYDDYIYYEPYDITNMFRVKAASATSTLNITVTDRFGNVYTETMSRPKVF